MKILNFFSLKFPEVKIIRYARFPDDRGYFTETYRKSSFNTIKNWRPPKYVQINESFSHKNTLRGLHFQWHPYMEKMVRTIYGRMIDLILDIRTGSPNFGKIIAYDMPNDSFSDHGEWIYIPAGFAHGNFFLENTLIEYLCTAEYKPENETGISPLSNDLDWSLCDKKLKKILQFQKYRRLIISEKDKNGLSIELWRKDKRSELFSVKIFTKNDF